MPSLYCQDLIKYQRRNANEVFIGHIPLGNDHPIRIQSMTNTLTSDVKATVEQIIRIYKAGADYVRLTIPSLKDTEHLKEILHELREKHVQIPVIADVHFNPRIAFISAKLAQKVRINPGNYTDKRTSQSTGYSDQEYNKELATLKEKLLELIGICRSHKTAIRIGTNHGSLSARIIDRYGDTPEGMVESIMECLRICTEAAFYDVVVSLKASNTRIMVYANRLLVQKMQKENMHFPIHLGVTEAGEGEDGRIKSAVGIGALLADGVGDTIRVSLTEDPEKEIPVAGILVQHIVQRIDHDAIAPFGYYPIDPYNFCNRETFTVDCIGGHNLPVVIKTLKGKITKEVLARYGWIYSNNNSWKFTDASPDILFCDQWPDDISLPSQKHQVMIPGNSHEPVTDSTGLIPLLSWEEYLIREKVFGRIGFIHMYASDLTQENIQLIARDTHIVLVLKTNNKNAFADLRAAVFRLINAGNKNPVIFKLSLRENNREDFQVKAAAELGGLFLDGLGDGLWLENEGSIVKDEIVSTAFGILQASRMRMSKTEYISCPSCGRTLFDLQTVTQKIRERTSHLKGLKIGIMGCIVNGPGEMADADYGYVGSGKGNITLYKGKTIVKKNIPESESVDALIELIKENGDWIEPGSPFIM
jgi:(E)-4-hydroxy-3-methylbut-2-enyl-diphosphate synthase